MGPYRVVRETRGRAYVLEELNGIISRTTVAAFRLIPYIKRQHINGWARIVGAQEDKSTNGAGSEEPDSGTEGSE